jgi:N6-adenosine-specific RNA methylase IME4
LNHAIGREYHTLTGHYVRNSKKHIYCKQNQ